MCFPVSTNSLVEPLALELWPQRFVSAQYEAQFGGLIVLGLATVMSAQSARAMPNHTRPGSASQHRAWYAGIAASRGVQRDPETDAAPA